MGAPGFDDAPIVAVSHGPPKRVTFVYPYYENPNFLALQLKLWSEYPERLKPYLSAIVVDDGSPRNPASESVTPRNVGFPVRFFRIRVDVRWNWLAARNIGMHHATGWCLLTDMDHMVSAETAESLIHGAHSPKVIYRFSRREHTGAAIHPHPNSMLMTSAMFWLVGGYDEALSGHYGTDGDWRRRCAKTAKVLTLADELTRFEYVGDSSTTDYQRKQPEDAGKKRIIAARGPNWRPRTLSFEYHEVL